MRKLLGFLLIAVVLFALAYALGSIPGEITARIGAYSFATSMPVAILALLLLLGALYGLLRLGALIVGAPGRFGRGRHQRQLRLGDIAVTRAFAALAAGDGKSARREAARARRLAPRAPMALLVAAEAARMSGAAAESEAAYRELASNPDAAFLGLRGLLRQALDAGDYLRAADIARRAELAHPGAAWLRAERARLALQTGAWGEALALAGPEAPRAAIAVAAADATADPIQALRLAKEAFAADPALAPAALAYARRLRRAGQERKAAQVVERAWAAAPHPDLATFYLEAEQTPLARVKRAEALAACKRGDRESALLLAAASLGAGLTGEARRHAEAAHAAGLDQRRLWVLMADIAEAEARDGGGEKARLLAHEALRRSQAAGADPRWRCVQCGAEPGAWSPVCPSCRAIGPLRWTAESTPARLSAEARPVTLLPGAG